MSICIRKPRLSWEKTQTVDRKGKKLSSLHHLNNKIEQLKNIEKNLYWTKKILGYRSK